MKKWFSVLAAALLLLCGAFPAAAEEGLSPSTPTDLCAHEHIRTVYYFDNPVYSSLNSAEHRVTGRASAEEVCEDCGEVLSAFVVEEAEEVHPHIFRWGYCALCGRADPNPTRAPATPTPEPPKETVRLLPPEEGDPLCFRCVVTPRDLEDAGEALVLRPEEGAVALSLKPEKLLPEVNRAGGCLAAEFREGENQAAVFLRLLDAEEHPADPEDPAAWSEAIVLRICQPEQESPLQVTFQAGSEEDSESASEPASEAEAEEANWIAPEAEGEEGFWQFPWLGNGVYSF